ncbi:NmrA family NAD(P)-binding protein [Frondihabitans australicus]|uniref:Uncharacterized protein YbjT (DUF2867 family) n=1 Tax=Frondihabitans australicus TaxID=386892 RepID=A0A495IHZ2_9MICO|nr:NmrA family NAD(P)-binding protein [Frondihabitans australicus]RKR74726.1 uncharacterized protein YbjT (DUF2867 family) [Frondihabitans australicus]
MTTILIAGATGLLGSGIASNLVTRDDVTVRLLVRTGWQNDASKTARIDPLVAAGAEVLVGDVTDPGSLDAATNGVDVVVSALQGGRDVIVDGQVALATAAVASGVRRIIPSDFAIDLFHAPAGAPQFEIRKEADALIEAMDIEVIHVLQGAFMDQMVNPAYPGLIDMANKVIRYWGTGDEKIDMTTVSDTAALTARVAADPDAAPGVHAISGALVSFTDIAREIEAVYGVTLRHESWGSLDDLNHAIAAKGGSWNAIMEWYFFAMLQTPPLLSLGNDRYADLQPTTLHDHLVTYLGRSENPISIFRDETDTHA